MISLRDCLLLSAAALLGIPALAAADDAPLVRFAPDRPDVLISLDLAAFYDSAAAKTLLAETPSLAGALDDPISTYTRITPRMIKSFGFATNATTEQTVVVIRTTAKLTPADWRATDSVGRQAGNYVMHRLLDGVQLGVLVDDHTLVIAPIGTMRTVCERDGKAAMSDGMTAMLKDLPKDVEAAVAAEPAIATFVMVATGLPSKEVSPFVPAIRSAAVTVEAGERMAFAARLEFRDVKSAGQFGDMVSTVVKKHADDPNTQPALAAGLDTFTTSLDGTTLTMSLDVDLETLLKQLPFPNFIPKKE